MVLDCGECGGSHRAWECPKRRMTSKQRKAARKKERETVKARLDAANYEPTAAICAKCQFFVRRFKWADEKFKPRCSKHAAIVSEIGVCDDFKDHDGIGFDL